MKSIITALTFTLFISSLSFAQPTKGTYVVGGSLSFGYNKIPNQSYHIERTNFSISPSIGKFISEKYQLNVGLGYNFQSYALEFNSNSQENRLSNSFSVNFGATRFFPIAEKLYFTLGATFSPTYSTYNTKLASNDIISNNRSSSIGARINIAPGLTYFINKKWMLYSYIGGLSYERIKDRETGLVGQNLNFSVQANSFGFGARHMLGANTK